MSSWKNYTILALIIVVLAMILFMTMCRHNNVPEPVPVGRDSIGYWRGMYDQQVVSQRAKEADFKIFSQHVLDSIAKGYNTTASQIKSLMVLYQSGHADIPSAGPAQVVLVDSSVWRSHPDCPPPIVSMRQQFTNPYYHLDVQIGQNSYAHLDRRDTLTSLWKTVKTGNLFNRTQYLQIDNSLASKDSISGLLTYRVPQYRNVLGITGEATALYLNANDVYGMGAIGLSKELPWIRATVLGGYAQRIDGKGSWYGMARINFLLPIKRK